jgi:hypothetical protein
MVGYRRFSVGLCTFSSLQRAGQKRRLLLMQVPLGNDVEGLPRNAVAVEPDLTRVRLEQTETCLQS